MTILTVDGVPFVVPVHLATELRKLDWYERDGYAFTRTNPRRSLHRYIAELEGWDIVWQTLDHINGQTLDNRLENLRIVTAQQNAWNRKMHRNNTSGYRGVSWDNDRKTWNAYIKDGPRKRKIGRFKTKEEASAAYEAAALAAFGEYYRPMKLAR